MQSENSMLAKQFETEIWLYIDGDLKPEKIKFWDDQMESNPQLRRIFEETKELLKIYDSETLHDIDDPAFEKMLTAATRKGKRKFGGSFFNLIYTGDNNGSGVNFSKIAFVSLIMIASIVILLLSEKPNSVKTISNELLDWEAETISSQINQIETGLSIIEDEKLEQYMLYKRTGDVWSVHVKSIRNDIEKLIKETDRRPL
ncbi:MAG: hypothetical protein CVV23_01395 [Ignavibacteriae bacterium HGW-Ignavibacteriae-2]|jgi:hypothetical protein|nr:MAG: hypothetical protein CVV23_01395 [Ignavibacteriae bacterium HGW-Ignavibacteriae-2]